MATGKTTVGKILADKLSYCFIDVDRAIEEEAGVTISEIFKDKGEAGFRELEKEALKKLCSLNKHVMACGGGAVMDPLNVRSLRVNSKLVLLEASVDEIIKRTGNDDTRPLLQGENPKNKAAKLLKSRQKVYRKVADLVIDTTGKDPESIAVEVLENLGELGWIQE